MAAKGPKITWTRGDSAPQTMVLTRAGSAVDLTGLNGLEIVVNTEEEPSDATNEQFRMPVTIVGAATDGRISFAPAGADPASRITAADAYVVGEYFYDLAGLDQAGDKLTLLNGGEFQVDQDINKG